MLPETPRPAPQTLDISADGRGDEPVDGRPTHTVRFGLDGQEYELDLSDQGAAEFRRAVQR